MLYICRIIIKKHKNMGRFNLTDQEKRKQLNASVQKFIIDKIGSRECKAIAEEAVLKEYKKQMRS